MSEELTPQEQLALETAKAATAKEARERAEIEERSKKLDAQNRDIVMRDTVATALASTGIKFHEPKDVFKLVSTEDGVEVHASADGRTLHCSKNGAEISFDELVKDYTLRHRFIADGRSLRGIVDNGEQIKCRADLADREEIRQYISQHGLAAYEALPMTRPRTSDPLKMTAREYLSLPMSEKARLAGELTELQITRILQRKEKP
jgi:hypothetical protein